MSFWHTFGTSLFYNKSRPTLKRVENVSKNMKEGEVEMEYRSTITALACLGVISIGLTGCGGGSSSSIPAATTTAAAEAVTTEPADEGTACPIPASVQQPMELNQTRTMDVLGFAATAVEVNRNLIGVVGDDIGGDIYLATAQSTETEDSLLSSVITDKVKALKEADIEDDEDMFGDNLPCDNYNPDDLSGTYSTHMSESTGESELDGVHEETESYTYTVSFNQCELSESDLSQSLLKTLFETSILADIAKKTADVTTAEKTYLFDGNASFEATYKETMLETSDSFKHTEEEVIHLVENDLSIKYMKDSVLAGTYDANQDILVTFNTLKAGGGTVTYENDTEDGNRTETSSKEYSSSWHIVMDSQENYTDAEKNTTASFKALCYDAEGTLSDKRETEDHYIVTEGEEESGDESTVDASHDINNQTTTTDSTASNSGYIGFVMNNNGDITAADSYTDGFNAVFNYTDINNYQYIDGETIHEESDDETFTIEGTLGSSLLGGSVNMVTETPWKMSSDYATDRAEAADEESANYIEYESPFDFVNNTPYAGKTVITGANVATVSFAHDDDNITYGMIQIDDGEAQEYDSIEDMVNDIFEESI